IYIMVVDPRGNKRSFKYFEKFTAIQTSKREPYIVLVVFTFDGNNIFFPIDDKPKNQKNLHYFKRVKNYRKKIPMVIASLLAVVCGIQIIQDLKHHYKQLNF
ncbi:MAG: hypothetical protein QOK72_09170, partial [Nitrososphaeraceae archaeon]|nr:hypothetical protein [Nitrososphaeraceae archaeon]